jgi:transposase-like protein
VNEPTDFKRWTAKRKAALVKELMRGQTTIAETARQHDLTPSEIEKWVDEAEAGMENALRTNPRDATELYEKKLEELHSAYGEAMLQVKALKKLHRHLGLDED